MKGRKSKDYLIRKFTSQSGRKAKITAHCISCLYDEIQPGTWREQTENCSVKTCSLFSVRPKTIRNTRKQQEATITAATDYRDSDQTGVETKSDNFRTQEVVTTGSFHVEE